MNIFKQLFCKHSRIKYIGKYYSIDETIEDSLAIYTVGAYKVFACPKCKKTFFEETLRKYFLDEQSRKPEVYKLENQGYISYDEYIEKISLAVK
jgi:hypothetical protein